MRAITMNLLTHSDIILHGLNKALGQAVDGADLHRVLDTITMTVEQQSGNRIFASISLTDPNKKHLLHGSAPSLPPSYNEAVDGIPIAPNVGACGSAAFLRKEVVVQDIATDPLWKGFQDLALSNGLRAVWSRPIFSSQDELLGTFAVYYPTPQRPSPEDRHAVDVLSNIAALIIESYAQKGR